MTVTGPASGGEGRATRLSPPKPGLEIRRSGDRGTTRTSWLESRHSFSSGSYYDPANVGFGPLIAVNEDRLAPGPGFETHPHRDIEIVTWVVSGALAHEDSLGHRDVIGRGAIQRLSAGAGVTHSERAAGPDPVHYVQMWVTPDRIGQEPGYARVEGGPAPGPPRLLPLLSGAVAGGPVATDAPLRLARAGAEFGVARLPAGADLTVPGAALVHLHLVSGRIDLNDEDGLEAGDTARITGGPGPRLRTDTGADVLVWRFDDP